MAADCIRNWTQIQNSWLCSNGWSYFCQLLCWKFPLWLFLVCWFLFSVAFLLCILMLLIFLIQIIFSYKQGIRCCLDHTIGGRTRCLPYHTTCHVRGHGHPWPPLFNNLYSWLSSGETFWKLLNRLILNIPTDGVWSGRNKAMFFLNFTFFNIWLYDDHSFYISLWKGCMKF